MVLFIMFAHSEVFLTSTPFLWKQRFDLSHLIAIDLSQKQGEYKTLLIKQISYLSPL